MLDKFGRTPLFYATWHNRQKVVEFLLSIGANPNIRDFKGTTMLSLAVQNKWMWVALLLLSNKADIKSTPRALSNSICRFYATAAPDELPDDWVNLGLLLRVLNRDTEWWGRALNRAHVRRHVANIRANPNLPPDVSAVLALGAASG